MSGLRLGDHVWLNPTPADKTRVAIGGIIKETKPGKILVEDDEGKEHWIQAEDLGTLSSMHPNSAQGVDDMIRLGDLNEAGMVHNLLIRYQQHKIYTYTGSILVAVNPFQVLPLYTVEQVQLYYRHHVGELPPHIFAIANSCYFNMKKNKRDQCCIIRSSKPRALEEKTERWPGQEASSPGQQCLQKSPGHLGHGRRVPRPQSHLPTQGHHVKCHCLCHTHLQRRRTFGSKLFKNLILSDESLFVWSLFQCGTRGMSLAVLGFRICALSAGAAGVISARGTSILHNVGGKTVQNGIKIGQELQLGMGR